MVREQRDAAGVKKTRIQRIHKMIQGAGEVPLGRFLATVEYQHGLSRVTTRKYLATLEELDLIKVDEASDLIREVLRE